MRCLCLYKVISSIFVALDLQVLFGQTVNLLKIRAEYILQVRLTIHGLWL